MSGTPIPSTCMYEVTKAEFQNPDTGPYISYGIIARGSNGECLERIDDISTDRAFVEDIAARINRLDLSHIHLYDYILDIL